MDRDARNQKRQAQYEMQQALQRQVDMKRQREEELAKEDRMWDQREEDRLRKERLELRSDHEKGGMQGKGGNLKGKKRSAAASANVEGRDAAKQAPHAAGSPLSSRIDSILFRLRADLKRRGATGIAGLGRKFRIMDDNGSKSLSMAEFTKGMNESSLGLSQPEIDMLFRHFDKNGGGSISYEEFLAGLRGGAASPKRSPVLANAANAAMAPPAYVPEMAVTDKSMQGESEFVPYSGPRDSLTSFVNPFQSAAYDVAVPAPEELDQFLMDFLYRRKQWAR